MDNFVHFVLKYTWMILVNEREKTHTFNIYNPLAYVVLIVVGVIGIFTKTLVDFCKMLRDTIKDSVQYGWQGLIVILQFTIIFFALFQWLS